jgi:hypothetical protein
MGNAWMDLVKKTSSDNKGKPLGEILKIAKGLYKKPHNNTMNHKNVNNTRKFIKKQFRKSRGRRRQ